MINTVKHKFYMTQVLKDIYTDAELANCLGFKGGTAAMFFYELPRFSVDLDFNLIQSDKEKETKICSREASHRNNYADALLQAFPITQ